MSLQEMISTEIVTMVEIKPLPLAEKPTALIPVPPRPALPNRIAVVGNYLPRRCGIATFTTDLCDAIHKRREARKTARILIRSSCIR
jgi:hypothetical protein